MTRQILIRIMFTTFSRLFFAVLLFASAVTYADAQFRDPAPEKEEYPKTVKETLAKGRIDREKKEFQQLIERGEEAVEISSELDKSFTKQKKLSSEDQKKLDRLEKLIKKIRDELGGDDDDEVDENKPSSMSVALKMMRETSLNLVDTIKQSTRYSISVAAIESSNALLKIVRFLRFGN